MKALLKWTSLTVLTHSFHFEIVMEKSRLCRFSVKAAKKYIKDNSRRWDAAASAVYD